jgi:hypothetical protein
VLAIRVFGRVHKNTVKKISVIIFGLPMAAKFADTIRYACYSSTGDV